MVIDTGVLISAFVYGGIPEKAVKKAFTAADIFVSEEILKEYREVPLNLEAEGKIEHRQLKALISGIAFFLSGAKVVRPDGKLRICRDVEDNMLFECCVAAKADFLITGDKDVLEVTNALRVRILTPRQYVESI